MTTPDEMSWRLFTAVVAPGVATPGNNNVLFETWASDADTFKEPPTWPAAASPSPLRPHARVLSVVTPAGKPPTAQAVPPGGEGEEVRRNRAAFDFIKTQNLYSIDGQKKAFAQGTPIQFPEDAIEVKANWVPIKDGMDVSLFHVNTALNGKKYALVSMHIISKQIPNWTWATFEHWTNVGRCDFIGCSDYFGATTAYVTQKVPNGGSYPRCEKTKELQAMFAAAKLDPVWANYCLKGSQTEFTTSTGVPTLLGNSVTEKRFVNTSSCITCHARAAIDANASSPFGNGFLDPAAPKVLCPTGSPCSPNGVPNPTWFWKNPGTGSQSLVALQTDFVWAIEFCAVPPGAISGPCS
jgi:hypothetical protein